MAKPFRYSILAKLVIGTFLSFFFVLRVEGTGSACAFIRGHEKALLSNCSAPEAKVLNSPDIYKVEMAIPGVSSQDLEVSVDKDKRTIQLVGNRMDDEGDLVGCYQTSWQVEDESIDLKRLVMQHDNGVLSMYIPKKGAAFTQPETKKKEKSPMVRVASNSKPPPRPILQRDERTLSVDAIAYDEPELLESVSVLTDEENDYWFQRT